MPLASASQISTFLGMNTDYSPLISIKVGGGHNQRIKIPSNLLPAGRTPQQHSDLLLEH